MVLQTNSMMLKRANTLQQWENPSESPTKDNTMSGLVRMRIILSESQLQLVCQQRMFFIQWVEVLKKRLKQLKCIRRLMETLDQANRGRETMIGELTLRLLMELATHLLIHLGTVSRGSLLVLLSLFSQRESRRVFQRQWLLRKLSRIKKPLQQICLELSRTLVKASLWEKLLIHMEKWRRI